MSRNPLVAMVHIAKKDLRLDDETYQSILTRVTGQNSTKGMSDRQLAAVVADFKRLGWTPKPSSHPPATDGRRWRGPSRKGYVRLLYALWGELARTAKLDKPGPEGLRAFVKSKAEVDDPEFLTSAAATPLIEALKGWIEREKAKP
ncbi:MAG: regulatory protein GemA [Alphaproteobacteria bacterium]|nr:regulatory protein GemA [Alphaproteobacteria bacterium]